MTHKVLVINEKAHPTESSAGSTTSGPQRVPANGSANLVNGSSTKAASSTTDVELGAGAGPSAPSRVSSPNGSPHPVIVQNPFAGADQAARQEKPKQEQQKFTLSPMRWPLLIGICVFGVCNGIANEINSVLQVYVAVMGMTLPEYVYLSQVFFFVPFLASFLTAGFVAKFGVRMTIFVSVLLVTVRNCGRALLFLPQVPYWGELKLYYWLVQRFFMAATFAMYYCLPLRVAESWFAENERSLALSLLLMTPNLGGAVASLVFPHYIVDVASAWLLSYINLAAAVISIMVVTLTVRRSKPGEGAPSARNLVSLNEMKEQTASQESVLAKVKRIVSNKNYLIHLLALNAFDPLNTVLQTILQDIFMNAGLTKVFCGQFLALSSIVAAIMQTICSMLLKSRSAAINPRSLSIVSANAIQISGSGGGGKTDMRASRVAKKTYDPYRTRTCKIFLSCQCATFLIFAHSLILHELYSCEWLIDAQWWLIIVTSIAYTLVRFSAAPYYNEQSAELICGKISEPLSSACQMSIMSLGYNLAAITFVSLRWKEPESGDNSQHNAYDDDDEMSVASSSTPKVEGRAFYRLSMLSFCSVALFLTTVYLLKFNPNRTRASTSSGNGRASPDSGKVARSTTDSSSVGKSSDEVETDKSAHFTCKL